MKWQPEKFAEYFYKNFENPYHPDAPWSSMRGDIRNTGLLLNGNFNYKKQGIQEVVVFHTNNSIFSTPIIGPHEKIYIGSADHNFYVFDPHASKEIRRHNFSEIIDSAACIDKEENVNVPVGDAKVHAFSPEGTEIWAFDVLNDRVKHQLSFSSNFWFEANIVLGPDGAIYVANDDFFLYKLSREGKIIWGFRTGFLIWSQAAFWKNGTVFISGFDHILYAIDMNTGKKKWAKDLHGSLVSSPAINDEGVIFLGSFNGNIYAIDCISGKIKWTFSTGAHIYASVAIGLDNVLYIGSTNGTFYALYADSGKVKWTYYIGDAIRSSASLGPDPEEKVPYLIYFGGGDGLIYALEPDGKLRWAFDTLIYAINKDYPNINASIALGYTGIAVASATGDVLWIPYEYYLNPNAKGIYRADDLLTNNEGLKWHYITSGGKMIQVPIDKLVETPPNAIINLRLLSHHKMQLNPVEIIPHSIKLTSEPQFNCNIELQSNMSTINIIPNEILRLNADYALKLEVSTNQGVNLTSNFSVHTSAHASQNSMVNQKGSTFKIVCMALPQPNIIPSLNQIGFASLTIPFTIIETDPVNKTFIAWAVQKFGEVGVPQKRISYFGFNGTVDGEYFIMESSNCMFEITSFRIPLDRFRFSGSLKEDNSVADGSNLLVEKYVGNHVVSLLRQMGSTSPITSKMIFQHLKTGGLIQFLKAGIQFLRAVLKQVSGNVWKIWGLVNDRGNLIGVGTYKLIPFSEKQDSLSNNFNVKEFEYTPKKREINAKITILGTLDKWNMIPGVLIVDREQNKVLQINYSNLTRVEYKNNEIMVNLKIPKNLAAKIGKIRIYLMMELAILKFIEC